MNTGPQYNSLREDLRSLPGQYWILFSGTLVNRFGHFVIPFLAIYLHQRGYDSGAVGITLSAYGTGALGAGVIGGYLSDKIGRKPTMLISCAGAAFFMLLLSLANSVPALALTTLLTGLFATLYGPAASALIADLIPPHLRVRAFSCQRLAINLGFAAGMATAGFMARQSFTALFIADAGTTLILGLTVLIGIKPRSISRSGNRSWGHALQHMKRNPAYQLATISSLLIGIVFWQMSSSYGLQTTEGAHLDERAYGMLMAMNGIMIALMELPLTSFTRRFRPVMVMAIGYTLIGVGMGLNAFGASLAWLIVSMIVFTIGEMISMPISNSYMASLAPDEMRGRYQGVASITWSTSTMIGPSLGIAMYQWSPPALWIFIMLISLIAAGLVLRSRAMIQSVEG